MKFFIDNVKKFQVLNTQVDKALWKKNRSKYFYCSRQFYSKQHFNIIFFTFTKQFYKQ